MNFPKLTLAAVPILIFQGCGVSERASGGSGDDSVSRHLNERTDRLDPSRYGVNSHGGPTDMLERFASIGLQWHRVDAEWSQVESVEGTYDWSLQDRIVADAERLGLKLMATLSYTPQWACGSTDHANPPRDPQKFVKFIRAFVQRYRGKFGCLGVWNEPNLRLFWKGTKSQYLNDILVPGLRAIREEDANQALCGPDLSSSGDERRDWMEPILASPAGALFDIITHHQYDGNDTVSGRVSEIDKMRTLLVQKGQGDKPFWLTETGWDTQQRATQALPGVMAAMRSRPWWRKTFWYDSHGGDTGLLFPDGASNRGQPQTSFFAYRDVIAADPPPTAPPPPTTPPPPPPPPPPTTPPPPPTTPPPPPTTGPISTLTGGQSLKPGEQLGTPDGVHVLVYQGDGNLVLYRSGAARWSSGTAGTTPGQAVLQSDGNFVVYDSAGQPRWFTSTHGNAGARLVLQGDGNVVVYSQNDTPLWNSGTHGP